MEIDHKALTHLKKDKILRSVIEIHPYPTTNVTENLLESLVESIIGQQLSSIAADTIYTRFLLLYGGNFPEADKILKTNDELLRACGISRPKIRYIKGLAEMVHKKEIDLDILHELPDEKVIESLITIKGIGRWTAEMLLMFDLGRPDIFSIGDLGLRNAVSILYGVDREDHPKILEISSAWSPYRTIASRYLWRSLDNAPK